MQQTFIDTTAGFRAMPGIMQGYRQLEEQRRWRQDQMAQRQAEMAQREMENQRRAAEQFGAYAVTGPDGGIDMPASARAMQAAQQAAQLGEAEALSGQSFADVDQAIRQMPEYRIGFAKGAASEAAQQRRFDALMDVQGARSRTAEEVARIRAEAMGEIQALKDLMKEGKGGFVTVTRDLPDGGKATYQVPKEDFARQSAEADFIKENKPTIRAVQSLSEVLQALAAMDPNANVKVQTDKDGVSTITEGGFFVRGDRPVSEWIEIVSNRKNDLEATLDRKAMRKVGRPPEGEDEATPSRPASRTPAASKPPAPPQQPPMATNEIPTLMDLLSGQPSAVLPMARANAPTQRMPAAGANAPAQGGGPRYMFDVKTGRIIPVQPMPKR